MYAAYLYILRAFDSAAASRLAKSRDPEREIADGRWPRRTMVISGQGSEGEARANLADPDRRLVQTRSRL